MINWLLDMKRLAIIITTLFALTAAASAESDPKKVAAILEGAKVCNATADPVACMTGFMAALGIETSDEKAEEVVVESSDTAEVVVETKVETTDKTLTSDLSKWSDASICIRATKSEESLNAWATGDKYLKYVTEAESRGLDCGVSKNTLAEDLKSYFELENFVIRKQTQYALKKLGYYKGKIDGKWKLKGVV